MAESITFKSFLMKGSTSGSSTTWSVLMPITSYPDMGTAPEALDKTTLSDSMRRYMAGILGGGDNLAFPGWYDPDVYAAVKALEGTECDFALWFGGTEASDGTVTPTGSEGKWTFKGYPTALLTGAGVNAVRPMTVNITRSSAIEYSNS